MKTHGSNPTHFTTDIAGVTRTQIPIAQFEMENLDKMSVTIQKHLKPSFNCEPPGVLSGPSVEHFNFPTSDIGNTTHGRFPLSDTVYLRSHY